MKTLVPPAILAAIALIALPAPAAAAPAPFVPGEVIVRYEDGSTRSVRADVQEDTGTDHAELLSEDSRTLEIEDGESVAETVAELERDPRVAYAVPNYRARAAAFVPDDRGFGGASDWMRLQWNFFGPAGVGAVEAWELAAAAGAPGGRGVVVAVIDSGVAYSSRGRFRRAPDLYPDRFVRGYDFVDGDPYPHDELFHGTHVAGTIAQRTNNGRGVTGLAYGAKIMPLRVLDQYGYGDAGAIVRAIRYATRRRVDVINMSLEFDASIRAKHIPEIVKAVAAAHRRGIVVVAASGNEGSPTVAYPSRTRHVISVGATTEHLCKADFSNGGRGLDVVAPGGGGDAAFNDNPRDLVNCRPSAPAGRDIYQETFTKNIRSFGLRAYSGTSFATPHVAAVAALLIASGRLGPHPTPQAVEQRLKETARDLGPEGYDVRYGSGLVDGAAALAP